MIKASQFNTRIGTFFGRRAAGDVGLEVECEFPEHTIPPPIDSEYWTAKQDGSLRNGIEYVLKKPIPIKALPTVTEQFAKLTTGFNFSDSPRTSVHCHINMTRRTFGELTNCLTAYYLFENVFVSATHPTRAGNLFCLRGKDADWQPREIAKSIRTGWAGGTPQWGENYRYAALNLEALRRFGSLEFRFIEGTTDAKLIEFWAQTLYDFVANTSTMSIDDQLQLVTNGPDGQFDFLNKTLSRPDELFAKLQPNWTDLVEENIPYAIMFRQAYTTAQRSLTVKPQQFTAPVIYCKSTDDLPTTKGKVKNSHDLNPTENIPIPPPFPPAELVERWTRAAQLDDRAREEAIRQGIPRRPDDFAIFNAPNEDEQDN